MRKFSATIACLAAGLLITSCGSEAPIKKMEKSDLFFFVLVKSNNYSQDDDGNLTLLNHHFFAEAFARPDGKILSAKLTRMADGHEVMLEDRGTNHFYEGGHFDTVEDTDTQHPNGDYKFDIKTKGGLDVDGVIMPLGDPLAGQNGITNIPAPITISFSQDGHAIKPSQVDSKKDLNVSWSDYSNGRDDPSGIVDDMIFVVFQNCFGDRIFHTGLPFENDNFIRWDTKSVTLKADTFEPGRPYSMFVEMPHVSGSSMTHGVPGFTSFATATYLDLKAIGKIEKEYACPAKMPALDSGQTDRVDRQKTN